MRTAGITLLLALSTRTGPSAKTYSTFRVQAGAHPSNGGPITKLQIDRRLFDGKIYIASGRTANDIELQRKDWAT